MKRAIPTVAMALVLVQSVVWLKLGAAPSPYRVLIAGDSITQGSSGDYTWRYWLWQKLKATDPEAVAFTGTRTDLYDPVNATQGSEYYAVPSFAARSHAAQWGTSFRDQLPLIAGQMRSTRADLLVVMLGANDLAFFTSPAQTIANLETYLARARTVNPNVDVVVGQVVHRFDYFTRSTVLDAQTDDYNSRLPTLARRLSTPSSRVVIAATKRGWDPQAHTYDGTHPNPTGEKVLAQRVSEGLAQLGIGTGSPNIIKATDWKVAGPSVGVAPGFQEARLSWSLTSAGASGVFIEQRFVSAGQDWVLLPYPVLGEGFTAGLLPSGGTYAFRLKPVKGMMVGAVGPQTSSAVG